MFNEIKIRIVLVNPSHPGNIGAAARAMKTMGFSDLVLVEPKRYPAAEAGILAAGADDILANAKVVATLNEAISDCTLVVGTSARNRSLPWPLVNPIQAAEIILREPGQVAILFGREDKGLKNEELQRCHYHLQIPANPEYSSLNIAAAVQVITYQLRMSYQNFQSTSTEVLSLGYDDKIADDSAMELFFQHLDETLHQLDFLTPKNPNRIMPRLRRLFHRAKPDMTEINIMRGILSKVQWYLQPKEKSNES